MSVRKIVLTGEDLSVDKLRDAACRKARICLDGQARQRIRAARRVVERIVAENLPVYGVTTGFGSQKEARVSAEECSEFNRRVVCAHGTRLSGPSLPEETVRAALVYIANAFAKGCSGVSESLVDLIVDLVNDGRMPVIDASGSVGASDLVPLAQIATWLFDLPEARIAGLPAANDALSFINCNGISLAQGALVLDEAVKLVAAMTAAACMALEGFRGNLDAIALPVAKNVRRTGQQAVAARMRELLEGSELQVPGTARFLQDPLSFRCISQVQGALVEMLERALVVWTDELNSTCDNPSFVAETFTALSHGNMDTTRMTLAVDGLRQGLAKALDLAGERFAKMQWPAFSSLPVGLGEEKSPVGGVQFLNLGHIGASLITSVKIWAQPSLLLSVGQVADGVEDTASHALHAVHDLWRMVHVGWKIVTVEMVIAAWAIHRRGIAAERIGTGLRGLQARILPQLPVGREGYSPFDLGPLEEMIRVEFSGSMAERKA
jgi:histidine ammonia-lyase